MGGKLLIYLLTSSPSLAVPSLLPLLPLFCPLLPCRTHSSLVLVLRLILLLVLLVAVCSSLSGGAKSPSLPHPVRSEHAKQPMPETYLRSSPSSMYKILPLFG